MVNPQSLFQAYLECPICRTTGWRISAAEGICERCGYAGKINGRFISLLPEHLSANNQRESTAFERENEKEAKDIADYNLKKPWNYSPLIRDRYLRAASQMAAIAQQLGSDASILFIFGGGGMEAHVSGLLGDNVVLADISPHLLRLADIRIRHFKQRQPAAYVECDAERLPFRDNSFDFVIGFEGVHHCLIPQAAMHEIWRVARRRAFVVDNYECLLTKMLYRLGASSQVEGTGVRPSRFSNVEIETMLYNANVKQFVLRPCAALPYGLANKAGKWIGGGIEWGMNTTWQANMFTLLTHHDAT